MQNFDYAICGFPGFLFINPRKPVKSLIICDKITSVHRWAESLLRTEYEIYVLEKKSSLPKRNKIIGKNKQNITFIDLEALRNDDFINTFSYLIIVNCIPNEAEIFKSLRSDCTMAFILPSYFHDSLEHFSKKLSLLNNQIYYIYKNNRNSLCLSTDGSFSSFPFALFQTSIISRLKALSFKAMSKVSFYRKRNTYILSIFNLESSANNIIKGTLHELLSEAKNFYTYVLLNRIAIISTKNNIVKIPLKKASLKSISDSTEHLIKIRKKNIVFLNKLVPDPLAINIEHPPYFEVETRCNGKIASAYTFKLFFIKKIIQNAATTLTNLHKLTKNEQEIEATVFDHIIGGNIEFLRKISKEKYSQLFDELRTILFDRLAGHTLPLVFSHGDYWLGNILVSDNDLSVTGIIDWDNSNDDQMPIIDLLHLLTTKDKHFTGRYFGNYIAYILLPRRISKWKKNIIDDYQKALQIDTSMWDSFVTIYWLKRCYLWHKIDTVDPNGLTVDERAWIRKNLYDKLDFMVSYLKKTT